MITEFDKPVMRAIRADIDAALALVAGKYGIKLALAGNVSFSPTGFRGRLEGFVTEVRTLDGATVCAEEAEFRQLAPMFGLEPGDYGKPFRSAGSVYVIAGIKPHRPKYPIVATGPQGGRYKFPEDAVRRGLGR